MGLKLASPRTRVVLVLQYRHGWPTPFKFEKQSQYIVLLDVLSMYYFEMYYEVVLLKVILVYFKESSCVID